MLKATGSRRICTKCGENDPNWEDDIYALRYITVNGRTAWYYANQAGQVDTSYTGISDNETGWWYVRNGQFDFSYSGYVNWYGVAYRVQSGQVMF